MEKYLPINENPNYGISDLGNCKNLKSGNILVPKLSWGKYLTVGFPINGKRTTRSLHQMTAKAFCENPLKKPIVNHIDGNKLNNVANNLEWSTYSENNKHAIDTGLRTYKPLHYKGKFGSDHNRSKRVYQYSESAELISEYGSISEANRKTGICLPDISKSARRISYQAGGYVWSYSELTVETFPKKPRLNQDFRKRMHFSLVDL